MGLGCVRCRSRAVAHHGSRLEACPDFYYLGIALDLAANGADPLASKEFCKHEPLFHFWWD